MGKYSVRRSVRDKMAKIRAACNMMFQRRSYKPPSGQAYSNPFKHKVRKDKFDAVVKEMSSSPLGYNPNFIRKQAWRTARRVPVGKAA
jgi:hypothetical protein